MPVFLAPFLALLLVSPQSAKLNPPLAPGPGAGARGLAASPDGRWILYLADQDRIREVNAYAVPASGGVPIRLSAAQDRGSTSDTTDVSSMEFNASSTHVAYTKFRVQGSSDVGTDLFLAALPRLGPAGRVRSALSPPGVRLTSNGRGSFSPDGRWFVYEDYEPGVAELRLAAVEGAGASTLIDSTDYVFWDPQLSPDGRWLVYARSACPNCTRELVVADLVDGGLRVLATNPLGGSVTADSSRVVYSVAGRVEVAALDGSTPPLDLGLALTSDETVLHLELDPAGTRVVVATGRREWGGFQFLPDKIFSAPLDGSTAPVELAPDFAVLASAPALAISPDGTRVLYCTNPLLDFTLFEVPIGGGPATQLAEGDLRDFAISPDSSAVVYILDDELRARFFAGADVALSGPLVQGGAVTSFQISPDAQHVVYRADRDADDVFELYRVAPGGGASTQLNAPLPAGGDVFGWFVTPDSARVAYVAGQDVATQQEVFSVPILGGAPLKLSRALEPGPPAGDVVSQRITADGSRVVYAADGDADEVYELYSTPAAGGDVKKLNAPLVAGGDVRAWELAEGGARVVYSATQEASNKPELFGAPSDGSAPPVKLNHALPNGGFTPGVREHVLSPSGAHVAYRITGGAGIVALHANRVDGTTSATPLSLPGHTLEFSTPVGTRYEFAFDASDLRLYYRQGPDLYSVPRAGGTAQKLNQTFTGNGSLGYPYFTPGITEEPKTFEAAPDGQRVVYSADDSGLGLYELYSVPSDGSAAPVLVSGPITAGGDVVRFEISAAGERVVYYADAEVDQRFELFSVPLDGSTPAVRLSLPFATGGAVMVPRRTVFSPDATAALFVQGGGLYRVAVDGSAAPVQLGSDAHASLIQVSGNRVLYATPDGVGLFGVPLDGSASPVQLNVPLVIDGETVSGVLARQISPDGNWVLYVSNEREPDFTELFARRIDGSGSRILLSGPLQPDGDVMGELYPQSELSVGPTHVVYRADQDTDWVTEIYSSPLPFP